jgi:hypothetical protein
LFASDNYENAKEITTCVLSRGKISAKRATIRLRSPKSKTINQSSRVIIKHSDQREDSPLVVSHFSRLTRATHFPLPLEKQFSFLSLARKCARRRQFEQPSDFGRLFCPLLRQQLHSTFFRLLLDRSRSPIRWVDIIISSHSHSLSHYQLCEGHSLSSRHHRDSRALVYRGPLDEWRKYLFHSEILFSSFAQDVFALNVNGACVREGEDR